MSAVISAATSSIKLYVYAALAILIIGGVWYYGHRRYDAGVSSVTAKLAKANDALQAAMDAKDRLSVQVAQDAKDKAAASILAAQNDTKNSTTKIVTIYKDHPLPVDCVRPPGAIDVLNKARDSANGEAQ
jgi:hypothetical protein